MPEPMEPRIREVVRLAEEAEALVRADQPRAALERAESAIRASEGLPDTVRAAALHVRGRAHDRLGDLDAAQADIAAALELEPRDPGRWLFMSQLAGSREDWSTAGELLEAAIQVAEAVGEQSVIPQARWELANVARIVGDVERARRELAAAIVAAEELDDIETVAHAELGLAQLEMELGEGARARERYARVRALAELLPERGPRVTAEPARSASALGGGTSEELPPPFGEPVLRVVLAPRLGEHAQLELWPGDREEPLRCVVPFRFAVHPRTHERLRWYAEEYAARPLDPAPAIAADVEQELERLGEALYRALLDHAEAAAIAERLPELSDGLRVEIVADVPHADILPWELLRDPARRVDLALAGRSVTRTTTRAAGAAGTVRGDGVVRVLLVIARPEGRLDVAFRSVADPLLRELTASGASVEVDVLRPPTFERLRAVLREPRPYDLLHFDGHGVVDPETGHSALVFESGDEAGTPVDGGVLGEELAAGGVPLLVMNACRSAAGHDEEAYGSVAREALERGLAAVVAMRFNVYVPTAALFVGALYRGLGEGRALEDAVAAARRRLIERPDRGGLPVVRDWCVPALYQAAPLRLAGDAAGAVREAPEVGLPPAPRYGFVGRDEVFVELEAALVGSPHVVLRAFAGAGKTTAAAEFARWYARTGGCETAGPLVDLGDAPAVEDVRRRLGRVDGRPLLLWDDARELTAGHLRLLDEIAARGGRVLVIRDRRPDPEGLPVVPMPNFPGEEALALGLSVAADAGVEIGPEAAAALVDGLRGHALGIELAVRELGRRGGAATRAEAEPLLDELVSPENDDPAPWTLPLAEGLEVDVDCRDARLVAQFRGYVSVPGLAALRLDGDLDAAEAALESLAARGVLTRINFGIYAIHPGLPVALAAAGRFEAAGRAFAEAMAHTASEWAALAESEGMEIPWPAELTNILAARRLASSEGWWPLVVELLDGVSALGLHGGLTGVRRAEILAAAADFVDLDTGEPLAGMDKYRGVFLGHLAWLADVEGDRARVLRLRTADVEHRRAAAAGALAVPPERRGDEERGLVRRLAVGLTNMGPTQSALRDPAALDTLNEAAELARELGDWRLEVQNRLSLGVHWMIVPVPPDFDRADAEFADGYNLAIEPDPQLAGMLMTERGTVHFERALVTADRDAARGELEAAADLLELAAGLREPDTVLCHQLGQVHRFLGNLEESRTWFEQGIGLLENAREPGAGADARLHLALALEDAGLLDEALRYARSAEHALAQAAEPDPALQLDVEQTLARLSLRARS